MRSEQLAALRAHVLEREGSILGFFTLAGDPPEGELIHLYVDPAGRLLPLLELDLAPASRNG